MKAKRKARPPKGVSTVHHHAPRSRDATRCMVAPSPELREKFRKGLDQIRGKAPEHLTRLLRIKDRAPVGMNDGLIYPGDHFPLGTPARIVRSAAADRAPLRGTVRVVVVLVDFGDRQMGQTKQHFEELFFSAGTLVNGSVREYFREVSNNLVDIVGEVVGPYRLPKKLSEYAHGESGTGATEPNARTMAKDAVMAANPDVNFGPYDNDSDGFVDAFIVIHAGPGAEVTGSASDIWSHKWVLSGGAYNADGTKIYAYLTVPEDARIGVCCHELGHLLFGFPDLYDTDYSSEGVGNWCLMGGGSWNGGGEIPAHPSAWCKANQGWASAVVQTGNAVVSIEDVKAGHKIYRLWKDGAAGSEYFLVENRQRVLFDRMLPGDGLLVWHVDESIASNSDENHPKVALEQADNKKDLEHGSNRGDAGDPYPGSANNTTFNATSAPGSKSYAGANTCVAITSIGASGPIMSARLAVKCVVKKKEIWKELHKEIKEKDFKDIKDKAPKEFKELKEKELKEKETKEIKDIKEAKEKESKEKEIKEIKDMKEVEKPVKEVDKWKDSEKPADRPGGGFGTLGPAHGPPAGTPDFGSRIAALEARLAALEPFIDASLRPDLRRSALASEEDVEEIDAEMKRNAADSKRCFDAKPREW